MPADAPRPQRPSHAPEPGERRGGAREDALVGESGAFRRLMDKIRRFAAHRDLPVVFEGETGTGKTALARHLHALSPESQRPFIEIDLGTLDDGIVASALLGHARGAFTGAIADQKGPFAAANGGTVFLDELENATMAAQRCLLRIVDEGEVRQVGATRSLHVDVRIIAATNVPLATLVDEKRIRRDLAARLAGCLIRVPPLRERADDIPLLVRHFTLRFMTKAGYATAPRLSGGLMDAIVRHDWPDNVRGLARMMRRLLIEASPIPVIGVEHCTDDLSFLNPSGESIRRCTPAQAHRALEELGTVVAAANSLGVSRATFYRLLKEHDGDPGSAA